MLKNIYRQLVVLPLIFGSATVLANTYHFQQTNPNNNTLVNTPLGEQLTLDVTAGAGNSILFTFSNQNGAPDIASSIIGIYLGDEGTPLFSSYSITSQTAGVVFSPGANPPVMPDAQNFTEVFTADSDGNGTAETVANGINQVGEQLVITGVLASGLSTFDTVISSILSRDLQFGLTIKVGNGPADKYLNGTPVSAVPLPAAGWLFGSALFGLMGLRRRVN